MRRITLKLVVVLTLLIGLIPAGAASAEDVHTHSGNMSYVKNLPYAARNGTSPNYGTDIEFATLAGKRYALGGSYKNGLQIADVSNPARARIVSTYD